jgi:TIR domain
MAHDVFISHALKDKSYANTICEKLESSQVKCWIAGRDISVGDDWSEAIRKAIGSSRVMVLVLSENANAATHLEREIAHAYYAKRTILPVRLTEVPPRREFLFYLGHVRWFDAFNAPIEQHLEALILSVNEMMQSHTGIRDALPPGKAARTRKELDFQDSRPTFPASRYRGPQLRKGVFITCIVFCALCLFWFLYSRSKGEELLPQGPRRTTKFAPAASPESSGRVAPDASPSGPAYAYTRLGLWAASSATPTPLVQEGSRADPSAVVSEGASPDVDHEKSLRAGEGAKAGAASETTPINSNQRALVQATPSIESDEAQVQDNPRPASEEEFLKQLVLDYLQTVASDDDSAQERFFSWRVNFYGKGLLSLPEARASMARYRQEWPIRNWTPRGEPEFPKGLHSIHPELYELLQPFDWAIANGPHHKNGSATLYVRIRKDDKGQFYIIHLEQRRLGDQRENAE